MDPGITRIRASAKAVLCHTFSNPRDPDSDPEIVNERNLEPSMNKKTPFSFLSGSERLSKWGHEYQLKIDTKPTPEPKVSLLLLLWPPTAPPGCQNKGTGYKTDDLGQQKTTTAPEIPIIP